MRHTECWVMLRLVFCPACVPHSTRMVPASSAYWGKKQRLDSPLLSAWGRRPHWNPVTTHFLLRTFPTYKGSSFGHTVHKLASGVRSVPWKLSLAECPEPTRDVPEKILSRGCSSSPLAIQAALHCPHTPPCFPLIFEVFPAPTLHLSHPGRAESIFLLLTWSDGRGSPLVVPSFPVKVNCRYGLAWYCLLYELSILLVPCDSGQLVDWSRAESLGTTGAPDQSRALGRREEN